MRVFVNAYGKIDSLGKDRLKEARGLIRFGNKPVIQHILDGLAEIKMQEPVLLYVNPEHKKLYEEFSGQNPKYGLEIKEYEGNSNPLVVYFKGLRELSDDNVLLLADDNLYDFSLQGLVQRFEEVNDNVIAVRDLSRISIEDNVDLNFGMCEYDERGKVTNASYSFLPETKLNAQKIVLDISIVHKKRIPFFVQLYEMGEKGVIEGSKMWWRDFYVWESKNGFWADIGKAQLRREAETYFSKD